MSGHRKSLRRCERLFWVLGIALLAIYALYWVQRVGYQYYTERKFEQELERSQQANKAVAPGTKRVQRKLEPGDIVGRLEIPRIGLNAIVLSGTNSKILSRGIGHIEKTALPGTPGNVALSAHRDTFFRGLGNLKKQDRIRIATLNGEFQYEVAWSKVVRPKDVHVIANNGVNELTLVTCYPFHYVGSAPKRYVVRAREVTETGKNSSLKQTQPHS